MIVFAIILVVVENVVKSSSGHGKFVIVELVVVESNDCGGDNLEGCGDVSVK